MDEPDFEALMIEDDAEFQRIMECVFGIREHETRVYLTLLELPGSTARELAEELDRDRSNINRSLSALSEKGLLERQRRLLESGGYVFQYFAIPLETAKRLMHEGLDEWCDQVHEKIDDFDDE